jgi:nucleoside diphosphate kinase
MLITPDAVLRHLTHDIVARVELAGLSVERFRVHWEPPPGIEGFHLRNAYVAADPQLLSMARELLELGPSIALLLAGAADGGDVFERVAALKGFGDPRYALPGSIRHDLGSTNVLMNLIHAADGALEFARDREIFLAEPTEAASCGRLARAIAELRSLFPREERELADILAALRVDAPDIDRYVSEEAQEVADVAEGMAYLRAAGAAPDRWAHLVLRTSMRFPALLCASRSVRVLGVDGNSLTS